VSTVDICAPAAAEFMLESSEEQDIPVRRRAGGANVGCIGDSPADPLREAPLSAFPGNSVEPLPSPISAGSQEDFPPSTGNTGHEIVTGGVQFLHRGDLDG
jgi:hypothetical protein